MYNQPEVALENYELSVSRIVKGRGAYICDTSIGQKVLMPYRGHEKRACELKDILTYIQRNGMDVEQIIATKDGHVLSMDNCEATYILKDYRQGKECSTDSLTDMCEGMKVLAKLHNILADYPMVEPKQQEKLHEKIERRCDRIVNLKNYIRRRGRTNQFEHLFGSCYEHFLEQGQKSAAIIKEIEANASGILVPQIYCHGDYNHHNVVYTQSGRWLPINFETMQQGYPELDVAEYMRKMLEKNHWKNETGKALLESYVQVRSIGEAELRLLGAMLLFPEKFCKLCNHYSNSRKSRICDRDVEKLELLIAQNEERELYLKESFAIL